MNEGLMGLEQHEGEWQNFHFWVNYPFNVFERSLLFSPKLHLYDQKVQERKN